MFHLMLVLLVSLCAAEEEKRCQIEHEGCTYNIYLSHKDVEMRDDEPRDGSNCGTKSQQLFVDGAQNDYTAKIDDIEKNFSYLRDEHEQRLKDLESTVRELLGLDNKSSRKDGGDSSDISKDKLPIGQLSINNEAVMDLLEEEFDKLRREIREKTNDLLDTRMKLNETGTKLQEIQIQQVQSSNDLLSAENQITALLRERSVLKNQIKDRSYKLDMSTQKAVECEQKNTDQQEQLMKLFRSESTLKEELMMTQIKLNQSKVELAVVEDKHDTLKTRHERTRTVLRIREKELMDCYSAKTSTFCGFEDPNMCGFTNINDTSDFFDWERIKGRTPSGMTGPSKDHTCDGPTGHFMYIEASAKGKGSNAILYSPLYRGLSEQCVDFFYHMYGKNIGTLNVYAQARGDVLRSVWRAYGNQGDIWSNARLAIPKELANSGYQIAFEGITENGYQGDISIDDVSVTDGPCPVDKKIIPVKVAINTTSLVNDEKSLQKKLKKKMKRHSKNSQGKTTN